MTRKPWEYADFTGRFCANPECGVQLCSRWPGSPRPEGARPHDARGLCRRCYNRWSRNGDFSKRAAVPSRRRQPGTRDTPREETLDEYTLIRHDVQSIRQAAERMGVTFSSLDKALYRARRDGDERGNAPLAQVHRAIRHGSKLPIVRRSP